MKSFPLILAVLTLALLSCVPRPQGKADQNPVLPRANPGYVHWLERQSMLRTAAILTAQVSGTERLLQAASVDAGKQGEGRLDTLLTAADCWLWVHPPTMLTTRMRPVWEELASADMTSLVAMLNLRGVYTAPTTENSHLWEGDTQNPPTGENSVSLEFAPGMGGQEAFARFASQAEAQQWQLGTAITPAATGLGSDFILATQGVRDFPGLYMMLEAPPDMLSALPPAKATGKGSILDNTALSLLVEKGLLPPALARDHLPDMVRGGWALTGPVRGNDGSMRRWIYRYHGNAGSAPLHWDDPSGNARKVFSASIIRQVGLLRHTLVGLHMEGLAGLDASTASPTTTPVLEPAPSAIRDLGREIRRYGGWSVQMDPLPASLIPLVLQGATGADFTLDTITSPAAEQALRSGQSGNVRRALQASMDAGIDQRRLLRTITGLDGPALLLSPLAGKEGMDAAEMPVDKGLLESRHKALTLFRGGLPGLLFVSGQDLTGTLPLPKAAPKSAFKTAQDTEQKAQPNIVQRGAWTLHSTESGAMTSKQGVPPAPLAYAPLLEQMQNPTSFAHCLRRMTEVRQKYGVARATALRLAPTSQAGSVGLFLTLPDEKRTNMLLLANFSAKSLVESLSLPSGTRLFDMLEDKDLGTAGGTTRLKLAPYQVRWIALLGSKP